MFTSENWDNSFYLFDLNEIICATCLHRAYHKVHKMVSYYYYYLFTFYTWGKYNIWQQATHKDSSLRNDGNRTQVFLSLITKT